MATTSDPEDQRVAQALRQLESARPPVMAKATQQLLKLAPGDPRLEEALCRRLNDKCLRMRAIAASGLGELKAARRAQPGAATVAVTVTSLAGEAVHVRVCPSYNVLGLRELLSQAVGTAPENLTIMHGAKLLEDAWLLQEHGLLQADAHISFIKRSDAVAKPDVSIEPLLQRLGDKSEESKMGALRALRQLAPDDISLSAPLLQCLQREFGPGGSFKVMVAAATFLDELKLENRHEFAGILANGFWFELQHNIQFFVRQRDPCHRLEALNTLADILARGAPDDPQVVQSVRLYLIFRLRVLGGSAQVGSSAANVIRSLEVDDPRIKDAFLKVLKKQTQWNVLKAVVGTLMQLPLDDLRMVEGVLMSQQDSTQRSRVKTIAAAPLRESTLLDQTQNFMGESASESQALPSTIGFAAAPVPDDDKIPDSWDD